MWCSPSFIVRVTGLPQTLPSHQVFQNWQRASANWKAEPLFALFEQIVGFGFVSKHLVNGKQIHKPLPMVFLKFGSPNEPNPSSACSGELGGQMLTAAPIKTEVLLPVFSSASPNPMNPCNLQTNPASLGAHNTNVQAK